MHDSFLPSQVSSWWLSYVLRAHCNENVEPDIEKRGKERVNENIAILANLKGKGERRKSVYAYIS